MHRTVLFVDDDEAFGTRMCRALGARGFAVTLAATAGEAMRVATLDSPEIAVVDLRLPDGHGVDLVRDLHALDDTTRIIVLTGYGAIATAVESVKLGESGWPTPSSGQPP